jgi:hypothetical protein
VHSIKGPEEEINEEKWRGIDQANMGPRIEKAERIVGGKE